MDLKANYYYLLENTTEILAHWQRAHLACMRPQIDPSYWNKKANEDARKLIFM